MISAAIDLLLGSLGRWALISETWAAGGSAVDLDEASGRPEPRAARQSQRGPGGHGTDTRPEGGPGDDVEREVDPQVDARERDGRGDAQRVRPHPRGEERDRGRGGERGGGVAGRERGVRGDRDQGAEAGIGLRRARPLEHVLERAHRDGRRQRRGDCGQEGERRAAAPHVAAQAESDEQRTLDPPRGKRDEHGGQDRMLERRRKVDQRLVEGVELGQQGPEQATSAPRLLLAVNGHASGVGDPRRTLAELDAMLSELGASAETALTGTEDDLFEALRTAAATGRRLVLVGGDGSLHAAANARLGRLPELALVPAGRANNIARVFGIPTDRATALAVAARAPARPLDALRVETPERALYALEAVSAGFHARARSGYEAENSADLRQGARALARAVRDYEPFEIQARLDGADLATHRGAQLFISNLPYFGFGFEVDPGADPADGRAEAILLEAVGRPQLLSLLAAAYRGRHLDRRGVRLASTRRAELTVPVPLVADAVPLGTTTAAVTVEPGRLRLASPGAGGAASTPGGVRP